MLNTSILTTAAQCFSRTRRVSVRHGQPRTDGQSIWLPGIKPELTPTELQVLRGFFDHECAHLIYDSFKVMRLPDLYADKHLHSVFNAIEDVRIEHRLNLEYPGTVSSISAIRGHSLSRGNATMPQLSAFDQAATALIWYGYGIKRETVKYIPAGWAVLDMMNLSKYDEVLANLGTVEPEELVPVAKDLRNQIMSILQNLKEDGEPEPTGDPGDAGDSQSGDSQSGDSQSDGSSSSDPQSGDSQPSDSQSGDSQSGDSQSGDSQSGGRGKSEDWSSDVGDKMKSGSTYSDFLDSIQDDANYPATSADSMQSITQAIATASRAYKFQCGSGILGSDYSELHRDAMRIARALHDRILARDRVHWSTPKESGHRIDRRVLAGVASGQTVNAFNRRRVDRAIHTQVSIILDSSGSMRGSCHAAGLAALTIADATETLGCPTSILAFSESVKIMKTPGRIHANTKRIAISDGCTNLLPALIREAMDAEAMPRHRRVVFVITDGETVNSMNCMEMIRENRKRGVTYFGICVNMSKPHMVANCCDVAVACGVGELAAKMEAALRTL